MELPETTKEITVEWLNQVLHENKFLGEANIVSLARERIGVGAGNLSDMAKLTIGYDRDTPHLPNTMIAKLPPANPSVRPLVIVMNFVRESILTGYAQVHILIS